MSRIVALNTKYENENESEAVPPEEELMLTREAQVEYQIHAITYALQLLITINVSFQETIAESEYIRAINFKMNGDSESCLYLLRELLKTQVLNEVNSLIIEFC